jgi:hypothetical protein
MSDLLRSNAAHLRALPERPNLEHLRNEAKARHRLLRATDPSAQLATAQREIAREYGFPSWRRLRAHVLALSDATSLLTPEEKIARLKIMLGWPRTAVMIDPASLDRFTGSYRLESGTVFTVLRDGDELIVRGAAQRFYSVLPESDCKFFYRNQSYKAQLSFVMGDRVRASALIFHQHGLEHLAKRIDEGEAKRIQDALEERRRRNSPSPGSEAALQRLIKETQTGDPNYELMSEGLAKRFREQLVDNMRYMQSFGTLISVAFVGVARDGLDVYAVRFSNRRTEWRIRMQTPDRVRSATFREYP